MKYKCANGHENHADRLPERCPACGSSLLRILSGGASSTPTPQKPVAASPTSPANPVLQSTASLPGPASAMPSPRRKNAWLWPVVIGAAVLMVVVALAFLLGRRDSDGQMAAVVKQYEEAVGVVILVGQKDGVPVSSPIATAWAVDDRVFVSNGHVAQPVAEALANGGSAFIVLNKHPDKQFRIVEAFCHPRYGENPLNVDGKQPAVPAYDIGLLKVDALVPKKFKVAGSSELRKLDSGYRVAYLGFPMENLAGEGVDPHNPVANMQSGIITSATDYWLSKAPFEKSLLLSHNLGATGGASGSPIFNTSGEVVGVLSAGNIIGQIDFQTGKPVRAPSAAMINFAQRIDVLNDIFPVRPGLTNKPAAASESKSQTRKAGGRILVKWKQNPKTASVKTFMAATFAQEVRTFQHVGGGKLQLLNVPAGNDVAATLAQYKKNDLIEYAEPDYAVHIADLPNDPELVNGHQWALRNVGEPDSSTMTAKRTASISRFAWQASPHVAATRSAVPMPRTAPPQIAGQEGVDIGAEEGWQIRKDAGEIIVAIVDTGVDYKHPDLAANMWHNPNPGAWTDADGNAVANDVHGYNAVAKTGDPMDDNSHGSHVAGIIGAVGNNNVGICGVAWRVKIMACKCLNAEGSGSMSDIIAAMEYAIRNDAKIINMSLGSPSYSRAHLEAIQQAKRSGVIVIVAAGNEANDNDANEHAFPACYSEDNLIAVGAVDRFGQPASFSNYGARSVHLFAPGVDIYSTIPNGQYETMSGTSMATPVVTGAMALVLANAPAGENYIDAINRVLHNTRPLPSLAGKCTTGGMINLAAALKNSLVAKTAGK